jgi:hypothetical protein
VPGSSHNQYVTRYKQIGIVAATGMTSATGLHRASDRGLSKKKQKPIANLYNVDGGRNKTSRAQKAATCTPYQETTTMCEIRVGRHFFHFSCAKRTNTDGYLYKRIVRGATIVYGVKDNMTVK